MVKEQEQEEEEVLKREEHTATFPRNPIHIFPSAIRSKQAHRELGHGVSREVCWVQNVAWSPPLGQIQIAFPSTALCDPLICMPGALVCGDGLGGEEERLLTWRILQREDRKKGERHAEEMTRLQHKFRQ